MQTPSDQEIQERFDDLPQEVRAAIQSADMTQTLTEVGQAHGLHVDQLGVLEDESLLVMLGFANPAAFAGRVGEALSVDSGTAQAIAEEISAKLFVPIRSAMRTYMEERLKHTPSTTPGAPPAIGSAPTPRTLPVQSSEPPSAAAPVPPAIPVSPQQPAPGAPQPVLSAVPQEGKTIMPSGVQPTIHPADQVLAKPTITTPIVVDYGLPGALQTPATPAAKQYATDPYREPVE